MSKSSHLTFITDTNVLIDYMDSDSSILGLVSKYVAPIYIPGVILDEIEQLDEETCEKLGIIIVECTTEQLLESAKKKGGLSSQDHLCLLLALECGWTCVTNDKAFRVECEKKKVPVLWGLELMIELIRIQKLGANEAILIARAIQRNNIYITDAVVSRFEQKVMELGATE